jgi:copper chaperone CopZ
MKKVVFGLEPLSCPSCIKKIETALDKTEGVESTKVLFHSNKVRVEFSEEVTDPKLLETVITNLGYQVLSEKV